jgi:hypothetical protein
MTIGEEAARLRSRGHRAGLLGLAVMFSAAIHAALVPEHLQEMPPLGWSFIAAAALGVGLAWALVAYPEDRLFARLAAGFLAVEVLAWVLFVTTAVPGFSGTPEPIEAIALVCKAAELIGLWLAVAIGWPAQIASCTASVRALVRERPWGAPRGGRTRGIRCPESGGYETTEARR